jgi:hypothetical protein
MLTPLDREAKQESYEKQVDEIEQCVSGPCKQAAWPKPSTLPISQPALGLSQHVFITELAHGVKVRDKAGRRQAGNRRTVRLLHCDPRISPAAITIMPAARWKHARRHNRLVLITDLVLAIIAFLSG